MLVVTFVLTFGDLRHVLTACVPSRVMRKPRQKRKILHNTAGSGRMQIPKPAGIGNRFVYSLLNGRNNKYFLLFIFQVGVVSPYAVVEVRGAKLVVTGSSSRSNSFDEARPKNLFKGKSRRVSTSIISKASNSAPKRKAPAPPNSNSKKADAEYRSEAVASRVQKKIAPKKPPRTFSTYLEDVTSIPEGSGVRYSVLRDCSSEPRGWVEGNLASLMADTVQRVYAKFVEHVVRPDPLWELGWQHLSLLSPNVVAYKGLQMSLQVCVVATIRCLPNFEECLFQFYPAKLLLVGRMRLVHCFVYCPQASMGRKNMCGLQMVSSLAH